MSLQRAYCQIPSESLPLMFFERASGGTRMVLTWQQEGKKEKKYYTNEKLF